MTGAVVASEPLDLPTSTLTTRATWYVIEPELAERAGVDGSVLPAALHAIQHAAIGMLPLFAICDRWDVGGVPTAPQLDTGRPTIVIYDALPAGAAVAQLAFPAADRHPPPTPQVLHRCQPHARCPPSVHPPRGGTPPRHPHNPPPR